MSASVASQRGSKSLKCQQRYRRRRQPSSQQRLQLANVPVRGAPGFAWRPTNFKTPNASYFSTRDISTTMAPIDDALAAIELLELGENFTY
jgi:hypothetical protein